MENIKDKLKPLVKYTADKIFSIILLFLFSPLLTIIFLSIWLEGFFCSTSKGSALYKEVRISQGKLFNMYKFRTLKTSVIEKMSPTGSATFLQTNRSNTTRTGKALVKFYLDELPQLFNILKGEMSLVGPRPRIASVYEKDLKNGYSGLKFLKGGITGLHQLSKGASNFSVNPDKSEEYYSKYKSCSAFQLLMYDINIMHRTCFKIIKGEGL